MKHFINIIVLALVGLTTIQQVNAQYMVETANYTIQTIVSANVSSLTVTINKKKGIKLHCSLSNEQGTVVFSKKIARSRTSLYFDLTMKKLVNGVYYFHIKDKLTPLTQIIRKPTLQMANAPDSERLICVN